MVVGRLCKERIQAQVVLRSDIWPWRSSKEGKGNVSIMAVAGGGGGGGGEVEV